MPSSFSRWEEDEDVPASVPSRRPGIAMTAADNRPAGPPSSDRYLPYLLVAPVLIWLGAALIYPLVSAIGLSVRDVGIIGSEGAFVGLDNYRDILGDTAFLRALGKSLIWVVGNGVVQTLLALVAALALAQSFPGVKVARIWIILTWIVPTIVVVIIWRWLLSTAGGMINPLLVQLGIIDRPVGFFASSNSAMTTLILINSWRWFPFVTVMLLAALQRIPEDLYEAAAIDGTSAWQRFRFVTWPLLQPTLFVLAVVGTLLSFNVFDIVWLVTQGGPGSATTTLPVLIYQTAFKAYRLSDAAAMSVIATVLLMGFALVATRALAPAEERR
jgi:multiple sugar transport system permease protein